MNSDFPAGSGKGPMDPLHVTGWAAKFATLRERVVFERR
jgi:hypothetical protein